MTQDLTRSLANVALEDVKPRAELTMPADARVARVETLDGVAVDLQLAEIDKQPWSLVSASYIGDAGDESDPAKAARQRVADINARVGNWAYWIPSDIYDRLTKPLEKQLEPKKKDGAS